MIREFPGVTLHRGDCLEVMPTIEAGSVDLILSDLPYGTTACKWDTVIPFEPLWACFKHALKPRGAVVLTASQPFTSMLVMSNREWFRCEWIWEKSKGSNFQQVAFKPMKVHESVLVFSQGSWTYNGQKTDLDTAYRREKSQKKTGGTYLRPGSSVRNGLHPGGEYIGRNPRSVVRFANSSSKERHPTQKPVALFEYLIKTYSNEGETVLDATIGSGTTALAAINTGRRCIGIERDDGYFDIACRRVTEALDKTALLNPATS